MSWRDYYYLFEKYDGDLSEASRKELHEARVGNPNTPEDALRLAQQEWARTCIRKAASALGLEVEEVTR